MKEEFKKIQKGILKNGLEVFVLGENGETYIDEKDDFKIKRMIQVAKQFPSKYIFSVRETDLMELL